jgi:hypothetical protein
VVLHAIGELAPLLDFAELSGDLVRATWREVMKLHGWDGEDVRCRLDNPTPYR